jgi:mannose-1-phosphate guanylyltransferase
MKVILPIILCGGFNAPHSVTSKRLLPKQFLKLQDGESLFVKSLKLIYDGNFLPPIIFGNKLHQNCILNEAPIYSSIFFETEASGTAFSLALCSLWAKASLGEDVKLLVIPINNLILSQDLFLKSIQNALEVNSSSITLFGSKPTLPSTEYGYINCNLHHFVEKPNKKMAIELFEKENYLWHSGVILSSVKTILHEFSVHCQEILHQSSLALSRAVGKRVLTLQRDGVQDVKKISFEVAVLEKTKNISCFKMLSPWTNMADIISFKSYLLDDFALDDKFLNDGEVSKNGTFFSQSWGFYETIFEGKNHKVKRIFVKPFESFTMKPRLKTKDYWVVVSGIAKITHQNEMTILTKGQGILVPFGKSQIILNESDSPLEVIETQIGNSAEEEIDENICDFYDGADC